jgi:hypothetical protein
LLEKPRGPKKRAITDDVDRVAHEEEEERTNYRWR